MDTLILLQSADQTGYLNLVFLGAMFVVIYFLMIRPQSKRQKEQKSFQTEIAKGDEVVTMSGILGKITKIEDDVITLEISSKTYIRVTRNSISKELTDAIYASKDTAK
ncbi:MAG: preprotein translocase subunit YajC [Bacteroidota bacterium]